MRWEESKKCCCPCFAVKHENTSLSAVELFLTESRQTKKDITNEENVVIFGQQNILLRLYWLSQLYQQNIRLFIIT